MTTSVFPHGLTGHPAADVYTVPEPGTLQHKLEIARFDRQQQQGQLFTKIANVGMSAPQFSGGNQQQAELCTVLENYVNAAARVVVLEMLSSEDFFVALAHSAGLKADPSEK
jgi:hypothetical protein